MKRIVYISFVVLVIAILIVLYHKYTTIKFNGIILSTRSLVTKVASKNGLSVTKIPPDGTLLTLLATNNISYDQFMNGVITNQKNETPIEKKIVSLKDGTKVYLKLVKTIDIGNMYKLYGHFEAKSISFILVGDGNSFKEFYECIKGTRFN